jgi:uncharacterized membrane protein YdjX (TVP38/TMEM64 family)
MPAGALRNFSPWRLAPLAILLAAGALFIALGGYRFLSYSALAAHHEWLCALVKRAGASAAVAFIISYAGVVALSVPGAALMTIAAGFLFGAYLGAAYAAVAGTLGATAVFLAARAGLGGLLAKGGPQLRRLEAGFRENAFNYLLVVRLVPLFPFWLVNLVAGATGMRLSTYLLGTAIGIIPGTFVYASLGSGLGSVFDEGRAPDFGLIYRPDVLLPIIGFALLALSPVIYRRWRGRRRDHPAQTQ